MQVLAELGDPGLRLSWLTTPTALRLRLGPTSDTTGPIKACRVHYTGKTQSLRRDDSGWLLDVLLNELSGFLGRALNVQIEIDTKDNQTSVDVYLHLPE